MDQNVEGNGSSANTAGSGSWTVSIPHVGTVTELPAQEGSASTPRPARAPLSDINGFGHLIRHWVKGVILYLYKLKKPTEKSNEADSVR